MIDVECKYESHDCMGPYADPAWRCTNCALDAHYDGMEDDVPPRNEAIFHAGTIPIFVYGTLLEGEDNDHAMSSVAVTRTYARTQGRLHYAYGHNAPFPVMVPTTETDKWVYGELVYGVEIDSYKFEILTEAEIRSGYDLRWAAVEDLNSKSVVHALLFSWPWSEYGSEITHGMWRARNHG